MTTNTGSKSSALVALDWGTSSLRAYRMEQGGRVSESRRFPWGIMNLPSAVAPDQSNISSARFNEAFRQACGDWLAASPQTPVIACGMVGCAQGWAEAGYLGLPIKLDEIATRLTQVTTSDGYQLQIIPGLIEEGELPNVIRGEETQVIGVLSSLRAQHFDTKKLLVGLPGTHSKWVQIRDGVVEHFLTYMTGEVFAALKAHTILGLTMQSSATCDDKAFLQGLNVAGSERGREGVLSNIFSCRTLGLTNVLSATAQADYLSGLLVGHEIYSLANQYQYAEEKPEVVLCGEPDLCRRYAVACELFGLGRPQIVSGATEWGLWQMACTAGLVDSAIESAAPILGRDAVVTPMEECNERE